MEGSVKGCLVTNSVTAGKFVGIPIIGESEWPDSATKEVGKKVLETSSNAVAVGPLLNIDVSVDTSMVGCIETTVVSGAATVVVSVGIEVLIGKSVLSVFVGKAEMSVAIGVRISVGEIAIASLGSRLSVGRNIMGPLEAAGEGNGKKLPRSPSSPIKSPSSKGGLSSNIITSSIIVTPSSLEDSSSAEIVTRVSSRNVILSSIAGRISSSGMGKASVLSSKFIASSMAVETPSLKMNPASSYSTVSSNINQASSK